MEKSFFRYDRLRELRLKRGYATVKEAAEALGMAYTTYTGYEKGERSPNNETLSMLASFFGVTTDYLLGRTEHPSAIHLTRDNLPKELVNAEIEWVDILEQQLKEGRIPKDEIPRILAALAKGME